jgi:hypothetical protein
MQFFDEKKQGTLELLQTIEYLANCKRKISWRFAFNCVMAIIPTLFMLFLV